LAIAGIPVFSGFFSKDEILAATFARAQHSILADASWLGVPGSVLLYGVYGFALAAALLTAIYMTRMMLYTFHGPSRTGEREREHLREAPWTMTGPLIVLGVLSAVGGWLNLPALIPLGPVGVLEHWLEPNVGAAALRVTGGEPLHLSRGTELALVAVAVLVAVGGIALAVARLRPERVVPKSQAPAELGLERVLANNWYVDEGYDRLIVKPTVATSRHLLWRGIDVGVIDGLVVNGSAYLARGFGWLGSQLQSGQTGTYAWAIVLGVIAVLGAFTLR
jgi:NADH-quinone oxidoreductase subunit L